MKNEAFTGAVEQVKKEGQPGMSDEDARVELMRRGAEVSLPVVAETYLHVHNGGTTFSVRRGQTGPVLEVLSHHFDATATKARVRTTRKSLKQLADMFAIAAAAEYPEEDGMVSYARTVEDKEPQRAVQYVEKSAS